MVIDRRVLALAAALLLGSAAPQTEADLRKQLDETRKQLSQTELHLEEAKRFLRFGTDDASAEEVIRQIAKETGLGSIGVRFGSPAHTASPSIEVRTVEISGRDTYEKLHRFLHRLTFLGGFDLQDFRLQAAADDTVAFSSRIAYPVMVPVEAARPLRPAATREDVLRRMIEVEQAALQQKRDTLATLVQQFPKVSASDTIDALASFNRELEDRAVALTEMHVADGVQFNGVALGAEAFDAIRPALETSGFNVRGVNVTSSGACGAFTATATVVARERPLHLIFGNGLFDANAAAICSPSTVRPTEISVSGTEAGGITLRLRDADIGSVLMALHEVASVDFTIDGAIDRRFAITVQNATAPAVLDKLRASGVTISDGRIHRVSSKETATSFREEEWAGEPVTVSLRSAELSDLLCLFHQISGLEVRVPPGLKGTVSAFATDVPWDQAMANVIASAGLRYAIDNNRIFIGTKGGDPAAVDACKTATTDADRRVWWRPVSTMDKLSVRDLTFAGVAGSAGKWKAYAFGPMRKMWPLDTGTKLQDARVESVSAEGVKFKTDNGEIVDLHF